MGERDEGGVFACLEGGERGFFVVAGGMDGVENGEVV